MDSTTLCCTYTFHHKFINQSETEKENNIGERTEKEETPQKNNTKEGRRTIGLKKWRLKINMFCSFSLFLLTPTCLFTNFAIH
ncbi:unnamed protein product [Trifolium pratense]|uniref:Uncharacterized protein n=1 Tax=Trifolium pratense TaxID=57577 RepID=A0ACB0I8I3_TRIPR|nr:unnamed protein product [Trifolium pratense]